MKSGYKNWYVPTPYSHWNDGVSHLNISWNWIKCVGNIDCQVFKHSKLLSGSWDEGINLQTNFAKNIKKSANMHTDRTLYSSFSEE